MTFYDPAADLLAIKRSAKKLSELLAPATFVDVVEIDHRANDAMEAAQKIIEWARCKRDESNV